ncbi:hypothetical protein ACOCJ4_09720 [Knoellia sp. CPCC 206435]|uniref:hypothetical protein n=1 Tax=Knoellia terrae TaxID=3404797 RepID=UPI003B437693
MTTRGSLLSARRLRLGSAAVPMLVAVLALGACSDDEPTAAPATSPSTSDTASATPSPTPTTETPNPTHTPTVTETPSATPSATPTVRPSATRTSSASPSASRTTAACAAGRAGAADTTGMAPAAAATAKKLLSAAKKCDAATLVAMAKADGTGLAGDRAPATVFSAGTPQNFVALATLLTMVPTETFDGTIQPRVFSEQYAETDAEWDAVVSAGLVTRASAERMRQQDGGYTGYRVGIAGDGTWTFFTTGR